MRDIESTIRRWHMDGIRFALARVVATWGSAPRRPGSALVVTSDMQVAGSLSGGCIEAAVISEAMRLLAGKREAGRIEYGVEDEQAWSVGLSCGGRLSVHLDELDTKLWDAILGVLERQQPAVLITRLRDGFTSHALIDLSEQRLLVSSRADGDESDAVVEAACDHATGTQESSPLKVGKEEIFAHVLPRPDELLIIGAGHIAVHLVGFARELGFHTVVIDPRRVFATEERFEVTPDELLSDWPDSVLSERRIDSTTYAVLLTHDPKIDDEALRHLLASNVPYIGALGSSRTHDRRRERLHEAGFDQLTIDRIHGPAGLSIGAVTPAEIAVAIMAQVVEAKRQAAVTSSTSLRGAVL